MPMKSRYFIDLFAGAGGLSEGFIREGFIPIAHVEMDENACNTLRTRECFHYLKRHRNRKLYNQYLSGEISREQLYMQVPELVKASVICETMTQEGMSGLFNKIDTLMKAKKANRVDVMIGGPPCQAYSLAGRSRKNMDGDPRNHLYTLISAIAD